MNIDAIPAEEYRLCGQYGFNAAQRQHRLALLNLTSQDAENMAQIQQLVIQPGCQAIMDTFYSFVLDHPELRQFMKNEQQIERLKKTQTEYLLSLGKDFTSCDYFEYRLRVGIAHARIEMPLSIYLIAYGRLQEILITEMINHKLTDQYLVTMSKMLMLDQSLAIDAYNSIQLKNLSQSIDALKDEKTRLSNQLMHDTLTGAYSRAYILEQLDKRLSELTRNDKKYLAIALIDLDEFKKVNDTYGHQAGDRVLTEFTKTIHQMIRHQDSFGRYGGEEFLLILVELDKNSIFELAERIRTELAKKIYSYKQQSIHVTASIGLTIATPGEKAKTIIARADKALYQAKSAGRNKTILL